MSEDSALYPRQNPMPTGIAGRCPRCGDGRLFAGFLKLGERCQACGLDFDFADSGDGPTVFVIQIIGFVLTAGPLLVELAYAPPIWLHMILWPPLVLIFSLALLRPMKGVMIALQYVNKARPGEIGHDIGTGNGAGSDR
ncbi:MAG: DUF983 domain-containing protein [Pseudomonadota bacterium]